MRSFGMSNEGKRGPSLLPDISESLPDPVPSAAARPGFFATRLSNIRRGAAERIVVRELAMRDMSRLSRATLDTSEIRLRSFALPFVGVLCAIVIGFLSEIRPLNPNSPDYGYDKALGTQTSSASFMSNCDDDGAAIAGASKDGLDRLGVRAIVAHVAASSTAELHAKAIRGNHVE
jgi:hypothetical protein